jgi:KUP system potassium uptake protein
VITPAISVLSAVGGIATYDSNLIPAVVPISCIIIFLLCLAQSMGSSFVGGFLGPFTILFFMTISSIGIYNITLNPNVLYAFNPYFIILYFQKNGINAYFSLGIIILVCTGVEAMYADMGHFGTGPARFSMIFILFPSVFLSYFGQAAWLMNRPQDYSQVFFLSIPVPIFWPVLILTTIATIIASQATITATFSLISQAIHLNYFPPIKIHQTSKTLHGQVKLF